MDTRGGVGEKWQFGGSDSSKPSDFVLEKLKNYKLDKDVMPAQVKSRNAVATVDKQNYRNKTGLDTRNNKLDISEAGNTPHSQKPNLDVDNVKAGLSKSSEIKSSVMDGLMGNINLSNAWDAYSFFDGVSSGLNGKTSQAQAEGYAKALQAASTFSLGVVANSEATSLLTKKIATGTNLAVMGYEAVTKDIPNIVEAVGTTFEVQRTYVNTKLQEVKSAQTNLEKAKTVQQYHDGNINLRDAYKELIKTATGQNKNNW